MNNVVGTIPRSIMVKSPLESRYRKTLVLPTLTLDGDRMAPPGLRCLNPRNRGTTAIIERATVQNASGSVRKTPRLGLSFHAR
jgi:hypothetical protein